MYAIRSYYVHRPLGGGGVAAGAQPAQQRLVAIERDAELADALAARAAEQWHGARPEVVRGDALALDWHAIMGASFKVAGNIPYRITTPLLETALRAPRPVITSYSIHYTQLYDLKVLDR